MSDPRTLIARLDGILVPSALPLIRADDLGVLHGEGVFETTLVVDGMVRDLPAHLDRMRASAELLGMTAPDADAWQPAVDAVTAGWADGAEMVLRLIATRGPEDDPIPTCYALGSAPSAAVLAGRAGVRVITLPRAVETDAPYLLAGAKSLSYATHMAALRWARGRGADDAIYLAADGSVLEGPTSNVVVVRGRRLMTPPTDGILPGITAARLLAAAAAEGWETSYAAISADDLREADGVYLTSSVRLLAPVLAVDGGDLAPDPALTAELAALLQVPAAGESGLDDASETAEDAETVESAEAAETEEAAEDHDTAGTEEPVAAS